MGMKGDEHRFPRNGLCFLLYLIYDFEVAFVYPIKSAGCNRSIFKGRKGIYVSVYLHSLQSKYIIFFKSTGFMQ